MKPGKSGKNKSRKDAGMQDEHGQLTDMANRSSNVQTQRLYHASHARKRDAGQLIRAAQILAVIHQIARVTASPRCSVCRGSSGFPGRPREVYNRQLPKCDNCKSGVPCTPHTVFRSVGGAFETAQCDRSKSLAMQGE